MLLDFMLKGLLFSTVHYWIDCIEFMRFCEI